MTVILAAVVITALVAFFGGTPKVRKGSRWIALILGGFLVLGYLAPTALPFLKDSALGGKATLPVSVASTTTIASTTGTPICVRTDPVTVTFSAKNKYTGSASGGTHRYVVDGGTFRTIADAGTASLTPGQKVDVLFMNASTVNNYYSSLESFDIPCQATFDTSTVGGNLAQNGTITVTYFNTNDAAIDGNGVNLTLGAGDTPTVKFKVQGQYQREHAYGLVIVAEYNRTSIDDVKVLSLAGQTVTQTAVPIADSVSNTGTDRKAYLIPTLTGSDFKEGTIYIDTDDVINPGIESDVVLRWYSQNYYVDETDGQKIKGPSVSDENNALTSLNTLNSTIHTV